MIGESRFKKVDYKEMSKKRCVKCNAPLKKNSEMKGHTQCYVCFKLSKGKLYAINKKTGKKRDFRKEQLNNIRLYKN
jgi:hypothetical protein